MTLQPQKRLVKQPGVQYPELDLHGFRREVAIRAVTDFLDQQTRPTMTETNQKNNNQNLLLVSIITGSGSHSQAGPVLRSAVESLLQRRRMEFVRDTPGSFLVNAQSGEVWYKEHQATDTKLIIASEQDELVRMQRVHQQVNRKHKNRPGNLNLQGRSSSTESISTASSASSLLDLAGPSVSEVMQDENTLARVKDESRRLAEESTKRSKVAAKKDLEIALRASADTYRQEESEFESLLEETLKLSQQQAVQELREEEALMNRVLQESQRQQSMPQELSTEEWEAMIQQVLKISAEQAGQESSVDDATAEEDEERMLEEVLRRSLYDTVGP